METFTLHIRRQPGFVAAAVATKIIVDGNTMASIRVGGSQDLVLPRKTVSVVLLTQVALGKDIEKSLNIDPGESQDVTLLFTYKFNAKSLNPFGAFTQQQSFIETEVIHGASINSPSPANSAYTPPLHQQTSSAPDEKKFCTECGAPNPRSAKFCQECGYKF